MRRLGDAYNRRGDHATAEQRLLKAVDICSEDEVMLAELYDDLGDVCLASERPKEAIEHYTAGRRRVAKLERHALSADILLGLARAYRELGRPENVRLYINEAEDAIDKIDASELTRARLMVEQAKLEEDENRKDVAIQLYESALEGFAKTRDVHGALECRELLMRAHADNNNLPAAGRHLAEILAPKDSGALWTDVLPGLAPALDALVGETFENRQYSGAVLLAFTACEDALRGLLDDSGKDNVGILASRYFEERAEANGLDKVQARLLADFWSAAFALGRNIRAHRIEETGPTEAFAWLAVAQLLLSSLDAPAPAPTPTPTSGRSAASRSLS